MKTGRNKILVAIDFEEQSINALEHSFEIARLFDADLLLLYVIEVCNVFGKLRSPEEYLKKVIQEAREKFDELPTAAKVAGGGALAIGAGLAAGKGALALRNRLRKAKK